MKNINNRLLKHEVIDLVRSAISEDTGGYGDLTSKHLIGPDIMASAHILCKEKDKSVLSGITLAEYVFGEIDRNIKIEYFFNDGDTIKKGDRLCSVKGPAALLLTGERTCLNFIQHLTGIATLTAEFVRIASPYGVKIVDTRKTKPGLRKLEKYAVLCGGGSNHRFGLFDGILIKDNHIEAIGGVRKALEKIKGSVPHGLKIEIEVKNLEELTEAIEGNADIIMLDNMDVTEIRKSVKLIRNNAQKDCLIEVSGNVSLKNLEDLCQTKIDIISTGFITHSAPAADISLEFE